MKVNSKFSRILGSGLSVAMLASTLVTAAPAFADVSSALVAVSPTTISGAGNYTITFNVNNSLGTNATITIVFPSDTTTSNSSLGAGNVTLLSTAGFGVQNLETNVAATVKSDLRTVTINTSGTAGIGEAATVRIHFYNGSIKNPSAPGNYTLTVATSNDTAAIASQSYTITSPVIGPLPGVVTGKNAAGQVLYQSITGDINAAMAVPGVVTVELGAGTYNTTATTAVDNQTINGVGPAGTVIFNPGSGVAFNVLNANIVISNVTVNACATGDQDGITISGNNTTLKNITFVNGVNQLTVNAAGASKTTVQNCNFSVTGNVSTGLNALAKTTSTNNTFSVDKGGIAIAVGNGGTITGNTITGAAGTGTGIQNNGGTTTVSGTTISSCGVDAIDVNGGTVNANGNTFTGNGGAGAADGVLTASGGNLILINNTISNSAAANYALTASGTGNITARFNSITGNTLTANESGTGLVDAGRNWWGAAAGPSTASQSGSPIVTDPLGNASTNGQAAFLTDNLTVGTTIGVDVITGNSTNSLGEVGVAKYTANPQAVAPTGTPIAYFDVYMSNVQAGDVVTIKFYGNVTNNTVVYYGGSLTGAWAPAGSQGVNVPGGYAFITVTATSAPSFTDLGGTPFVITNIIPAPAAPALLGPAAGTTGVPVNTGFSWSSVTGADTYNFQLSTSPTFATTLSSQTGLAQTVFGGVTLTSNTTYFWRVQAVNAGGISGWATSTFTTSAPVIGGGAVIPTINITIPTPNVTVAPAQVTVNPPSVTVQPAQVTVQPPPPAQVTVNPPTVNVAAPAAPNVSVQVPPTTQAIPTYILWTIILIGAVLIIALIVLIVRTRRTS